MFRFGSVAVMAVVVGLGSAPAASADDNSYLQEVRAKTAGMFSAGNSQLLQVGYVACRTLRNSVNNGLSASSARSQSDQAVAGAAWNMGLTPGKAGSMWITEAAEHNLSC